MNSKIIKIIGFVATIVGIGSNLLSEWVSDKKLDSKIDCKINKVMTKKNETES